MSAKQAAEALGISLRHTRRLLAAYRKEGAQALAHGNRGRKPPNILDDDLRRKTVELARTTYQGFNNSHFTELLSEREGINLSRSTIRRILLGEGIRSPRKRRPPKHRSRRERYPREGMLLQIDGSRDDWLEGRGPYLTLIGAIDDATGIVPWAVFRYQEDAQGYVLLLQHIVMDYGVAYSNAPKGTMNQSKSSLKGRGGQRNSAGLCRNWVLPPLHHVLPSRKAG